MSVIIDTRSKYRVGSPLLPVLPVESLPIQVSTLPDWRQHSTQIGNILDHNGITSRIIDIAHRCHPGSKPGAGDITVTIRADWTTQSDVTWPNAVREIRTFLDSKQVPFAVEIITHGLFRGLRPFPFAQDIYNWNDGLLAEIRDRIKDHQWISLDMVYREHPDGSGAKWPAILIGALDADENSWWDVTLPALKQLEGIARLKIHVELFHGEDCFFTATRGVSTADNGLLTESFQTSMIPYGASCGVRNTPDKPGNPGTGTFGGLVVLKDPYTGQKLATAISNHHVLVHNATGTGPHTTFERPIVVESPSPEDRQAYAQQLEDAMARYDHIRQRFGVSMGDAEQHVQRQIDMLREFDTCAGTVFASSGLRGAPRQTGNDARQLTDDHPESWALDWALTALENRAVLPCTKKTNYLEAKDVTSYCSINPDRGYKVWKEGRTTGSTLGYISATQSVHRLRIPEPENGPTVSLTSGNLFNKEVRCHVMIADPKTSRSGVFIESGDSGSLILVDPEDSTFRNTAEEFSGHVGFQQAGDSEKPLVWDNKEAFRSAKSDEMKDVGGKKGESEAYVVGLAFGSCTSTLLSYMMPFDFVVQDIESATGLKVTEPAKALLDETRHMP